MSDTNEELCARLLDAARAAGAEAADAMALRATSISINARGGVLDQAERSEGIDLGLRVLIGQRQACVSVSDTSDATLSMMAERAVAMAREAPEDPFAGLAAPDELAQDTSAQALELADPAPEPAVEVLQSDALEAEAAALAVSGVTQVDPGSAGYSQHQMHIAASNGFSAGYERTGRWTYAVAIAGTGLDMERDSDSDNRTFQSDLRPPSEIGRIAGERAVAQQGARKPPSGRYPVLYDERISSSLISHLLSAANGTAIARGASWLRDSMGAPVLPDGVDLIEEPLRPRAMGSRPFDGEGLPTATRPIVQDGVLQSWILDLATARKLGLRSTANAARYVGAPPSPSAWNMTLTPGTQSRSDLMAQMGTGLLVTGLIGSTINPNTGDYSRGASGFWVENGEIAYPVNECTIAGSLPDMLRGIIPANDARDWLSYRVPSLLVEGLTLA